jgi:hypothetical protein
MAKVIEATQRPAIILAPNKTLAAQLYGEFKSARAVPELQVDLPATAIGKDYLRGSLLTKAPSGSGYQVSLRGLLGVTASKVDGLELNLLGLNFGVGPNGVKLPLVGIIGGFTPSATASPVQGAVPATN